MKEIVCVIMLLLLFALALFDVRRIEARIEDKLGDVMLVLSRGWPGSGYLMRVISNVADCTHRQSISGELFMANRSYIGTLKTPTKYLRQYFKDKRKKVGPRDIIGCKWKPYADNIHFDKAWRYVAWQGWPVMYSHCNPLDVVISTAKHAAAPLQPHCAASDSHCLEQFHRVKVHIDVSAALAEVHREMQETAVLRRKLQHFGVRFTELTYEQLVFGSAADRIRELQRAADFFIPTHRRPRMVTLRDFHTDIVMTGSHNQSQYVSNYDALYAAFEKTPYKNLLHP